MQKKKKALVLLSGGLAGAVSAGFISELCKNSSLSEFSAIYCYSVGVYPATFGLAEQPGIIDEVWRNHIDGLKLVNPFNILSFGLKPVLKLAYLEKLFRKKFKLDIEKVLKADIKLKYALMEAETGKVVFEPPRKKNILKLMSAACAIPFLHGVCTVEGKKYLDPTFVHGLAPSIDNILKKHSEIIVVHNFPKGYIDYDHSGILSFCEKALYPLIAKMYTRPLQTIFKRRKFQKPEMIRYMEVNKRITLLRPEKLPLRTAGDTNKNRINKTFDEGIRLARKYMNSS